MLVGVRHENGKTNIVNVTKAESYEEVIQCVKQGMPTAKTILVDMSNPDFVKPEPTDLEAA